MPAPEVRLVFVHGLFKGPAVWEDFTALVRGDPAMENVRIHTIKYDTPRVMLRPKRRIPGLDAIAAQLRTDLDMHHRDADSIVIVTHSQGGLVVQRMLHQVISNARAHELTRIKAIVMFACPNSGSAFLLSLRRILFMRFHSQEKQLRPLDRGVIEAQRTVLRSVVHARKTTSASHRIRIIACGAASDNVVPEYVATSVFPETQVVSGDHSTVIRPKTRDEASYQIVRNVILAPPPTGDRTASADDSGPTAVSSPVIADDPNRQNSVSVPTHLRPPRVRGRDALIHSLSDGGPNRVHVLAGLQGVGKTCVALELARRLEAARWDVWWIRADHVDTDMFELAQRLGISYVEHVSTQREDSRNAIWQRLDQRLSNWLLVFDNARSPEALGPVSDSGVSLLNGWLRSPATDKGRVVVTSHIVNHEVWGPHCMVHEVQPLDDDDGASMIRDHTGERAGTFEEAKHLSRELGGIPQSLMNAATYLKSVTAGASIADGRGRNFKSYQEAVAKLDRRIPQDTTDPVLRSLKSSFGISAQALVESDQLAADRLLKILACMDRSQVPYDLLLRPERLESSALFTGIPAGQLNSAVQSLADFGLVTLYTLDGHQDPLRRRLELHPFAHTVFRDAALSDEHGESYHAAVLDMLQDATADLDPDLPDSWSVWAAVVAHVATLAANVTAPVNTPYDRRLIEATLIQARRAGRYMIAAGYFEPAAELLHPLIDRCNAYGFSENSPPVLALRHEKGRLAIERGDYQAAKEQLTQLVEDRSRVLGNNHADTWATRHKLIKVVLEQGDWAYAEPELQRILRAEKQIHRDEPAHRDVITVWHTLARTMLGLGKYAEAEAMCGEILTASKSSLPPSDNEVLFLRQTLARALLAGGRPQVAEQVISEAIKLVERPQSPRVLAQRHVLCLTMVAQGRWADAVASLEELVTEEERELGTDHPLTQSTRETLLSTISVINDIPGV